MAQKNSFSMQDQNSGSVDNHEPEFLAVGKFRRPHGVRGEIVMSVWTDFPDRLAPGMKILVGEKYLPVHIRSVRWHRDDLLIALEEYDSREEVGNLRNLIVSVPAGDLPELDDGEIYLHEILGMTVINIESGEVLGQILEIIETGANDVYIVRHATGSELLLPAIEDVILQIDLEKQEIQVKLLPGLLGN
jgi:16S rRNA processing protein RimM